MGNKPNRFLHAILCLENLSSGLNRAGCALRVGFPSGAVFCKAHHHSAAAFTKKAKNRQERERIISKNSRPKKKPTTQSSSGPTTRARERDHNKQRHTSPPTNDERKKETNKRAVVVVAAHLERVHALPVLVQVVHEIHDDDVKKTTNFSRAEYGAKIVCQKSGLSNETHFLQFFICVL